MIPMEKLSIPIGAIIALLGVLWGTYTHLESTYAKAEHLQLVSIRLDQKILNDRRYQLQERVWRYEDRYGKEMKGAPPEIRYEYRRVTDEMSKLGQSAEAVSDQLTKKYYTDSQSMFRQGDNGR